MRQIDLTGKRAVVVGGATGIGRASAYALAQAGANVVTLSRRSRAASFDGPSEVAARITHRALDISRREDVVRTFSQLATGGLDIVVLSAAVIEPASAVDADDALWRRHMDVNVDGTFTCVRESIRHMLAAGTAGKVVVIGSISGLVGNPGFAAYCASKGLWVNLTRQLALDCAPRGINVNSVLPGFTMTDLADIYDDETKATIAAAVPAKVWAAPEQIADAVLFLASPLADYVHGVSLPVDGGYVAAGPI
ncbi:SDR family NAD(P)-dependent oxidoreductase [Dactylosporangium sp. CA-233914]|uniref:SDR family NAD(P)-dependent oxidoreductase n=1 Tax=Dactylosporangium sp. CA-233914 TaxID=3239934 RepID=UPI003D90DA19